MTRLSDARFGPSAKRLADLSDKELLEERTRRRGEQPSKESRPTWKRVKQYLKGTLNGTERPRSSRNR
jgi:hypothetical protein